MAKIYISYSKRDSEIAIQIAAGLKAHGHEIVYDIGELAPGVNWRRQLLDGLKSSDVFVPLLTDNSIGSQFVLSEIGSARAFSEESKGMLLIPVLLDKLPIPPVLSDFQVIFGEHRNVTEICMEIDRGVHTFLGRRAAVEKAEGEVKERIESNAPEFIDEAIASLKQVERRYRLTGTTWYIAGFLSLVLGLVFAFIAVTQAATINPDSWIKFAYLALKAVIVIGLLAATSKYCFVLGKSYVSESLKNADRLHAISFGRFYLRVFGAKASWPELKEAFQHWNIDRRSTFYDLTTDQIDPKLIDAVIEISKAVSAKKEDKK
jgi:hypothetical protein